MNELPSTSQASRAFLGSKTRSRARLRGPPPSELDLEDEVLQMELVATDGGQFNERYGPQNMLKDNNEVYCSIKREAINVVVSYCPGGAALRPFTITGLDAAAPAEGYTSPLGQGIVFTSWAYPNISATQHFDGVSCQQEFDALRCSTGGCRGSGPTTTTTSSSLGSGSSSSGIDTDSDSDTGPLSVQGAEEADPRYDLPNHLRRYHIWAGWRGGHAPTARRYATPRFSPSDPSTPQPVLFFDLGGDSRRRFTAEVPCGGRYVLVKLLRSKCKYADNIDVQYVGLRGWTAPPCFASGALA
mmetsp:Transcript_5171/g.11261  ORF Transcript_5171/g.11261 Transcript_5171/m.11261 type:complete len:300 (+) Transcript_5171:189-1088(+)